MPEFLANSFNLDLGEKQSGEKVCLLFSRVPFIFFRGIYVILDFSWSNETNL